MKTSTWTMLAATLGLTALLAARTSAQKDDPATKEGVEVLARGPVHEAFASPSQARPLPSHVVPNRPPDAIDEVPPDEKPAGDHVIWIPGYWAWDDEQKDNLWVSGFWRVPPSGRQWVPGNWQQVEDGWQWTSGFWAAADQEEVTYLPAPPPSIDEGPSVPAPDDNSTYVAGCPVSGSATSRTGSGRLPITCGRRAVTSSWTASGIGRSTNAAYSSPRFACRPPC
jgi:hypothetical protein